MRRRTTILGSTAALVVLLASPAIAQEPRTGDASLGFQLMRDSRVSGAGALGPQGSVAGRVRPYLSVVVSVGVAYGDMPLVELGQDEPDRHVELRYWTFAGGVRVSRRERTTPFAHMLIGLAAQPISQGTASAGMFGTAQGTMPGVIGIAQPGGGMDIALANTLGLRVGADYLIDLRTAYGEGSRGIVEFPRTRWRVTVSAVGWFGR